MGRGQSQTIIRRRPVALRPRVVGEFDLLLTFPLAPPKGSLRVGQALSVHHGSDPHVIYQDACFIGEELLGWLADAGRAALSAEPAGKRFRAVIIDTSPDHTADVVVVRLEEEQ